MSNFIELRKYFEEKLLVKDDLRKYLEVSAIVTVELDQELIYDLMVIVPDQMFESDFRTQFGECFVVNDQEYSPPVFTRFKSYQWLLKDLSHRLPIALWIFKHAVVIQDPEGAFDAILRQHNVLFEQEVKGIIRRKYIEFRSDRHNLRQAVHHSDDLAINLLKANVIKIAMEILMLAHGQPYPYKKWLPPEARKFEQGSELVQICTEFMVEKDAKKIITLSDGLVGRVVHILSGDDNFSPGLLNQWWLHLS